jgi:hypothetical protein
VFNRELVTRGIVKKERLLAALESTTLDESARGRIRAFIELDFR